MYLCYKTNIGFSNIKYVQEYTIDRIQILFKVRIRLYNLANSNMVGYNGSKLGRPISHSNIEVTKLILGLVMKNAWLIGLEYWSKNW